MSSDQLREGGLIAPHEKSFQKLPIRRHARTLNRRYAAEMVKDNAELSAAHGRGSHESPLVLYKLSPCFWVARTFFLEQKARRLKPAATESR
jgi:hypothetical protein